MVMRILINAKGSEDMKKLLALLLAAMMMTALFAGCSNGETEQTDTPDAPGTTEPEGDGGDDSGGENAARDDVTVWGNMMIDNYNPIDWSYAAQNNLFESVYSTLVKINFKDDGTAELAPGLAETWETEQDGAVWVFHLNPDAVFTNGEPVTAEDVKFSFESYAQSAFSAPKVEGVVSVEARDEHTVAINTGEYDARSPWNWHQVAIVEADAYQADAEAYMDEQIGSGPYKLESLDAATGNYTLVASDTFYGEKPAIGTVNVRVIADQNSAVIALQNGEIDYMYMAGLQYDLVKDDENLETQQQPGYYGGWLLLNASVEPLNNQYLRQAIGYAIDYDAQAQIAYGGYVADGNSTVMFGTPVDPLPEGLNMYSYDPEKAKELVAQSGLETPIDIGDFYGGSGGRAELIQQNLAAVGITCQPVSLENFAMLEAYQKGNYSIGLMGGIGGGYMTAADQLASLYGSDSAANLPHYSNPEVDDLIITLNRTQDKAAYDALVAEILQIVIDDACSFNTGAGAYFSAYAKGLKVPTADTGLVRFAELSW